MIVMKFGGTSVEDARAIRNVSQIVQRHIHQRPVVVASACAGVTNALLALARASLNGGASGALDQVEQLRARHQGIAHELFSGDVLFTVQSLIDAMLDELRDLAKSISILGELTNRSLDTFASFGEKLSTYLLYHQLRQDAVESVLINVQEIMITNNEFTRAVPLFEEIDRRVRTILLPKVEAGMVVVTQGFLGATTAGVPTTIGRGGSDYSAAILGAALEAEEIQIWTDVDGIMTCDPSTIPEARLIKELSFREAAELAYFGAKVLHPATILPAVQKNIPVKVLNSKRPETEGSVVVREARGTDAGIVKSIAFKEHITLISITSTRMLMMHGFLARVFEVFAKYQKSVDVIATSEVSISLTVDSDANLEAMFEELRQIADVDVTRNKAIFCVVGEHLKGTKGVIPRIFSTLDRQGIALSMISLGASEINVTFVVDEDDILKTARALHEEFFPLSV
jgi:aspartate kinase